MIFIDKLSMLLLAPPKTGVRAFSYIIACIALPTLIRWSVDPFVRETGFVPYFPFVLLAAIEVEDFHHDPGVVGVEDMGIEAGGQQPLKANLAETSQLDGQPGVFVVDGR